MAKPMIELRGITKRFPGVLANDGIDLDIYPGEIHALLGENGSGKSTLMCILSGLYKSDGGSITMSGEEKRFRSPRDAIACGIGMVHQHFKLVEPFSVAENIAMSERDGAFLLSTEKMVADIAALGGKYGLAIQPEARVWQLSVGEKQRVEIVRMLYHGSRVLILDEPTAVLTPQEASELFVTLRKMADDGCAVVFITHKLGEVYELADRVTVLRHGRVTGVLGHGELDTKKLVSMMVGRDVVSSYERDAMPEGPVVLEMDKVIAFNDMGMFGLKDLSLKVGEGEIFGIAGVAGNGQRELAEVITGLRRSASGTIRLYGEKVTNLQPAEMIGRGVSYVPEDRLGMGLVPDLNVVENLLLKSYQQPEYSGRWLLNGKAIHARAARLVEQYKVKVASLYSPVKMLSGGHLQRLLLAREIAEAPRLMVVVYPARGLDVGATEAVHRLLLDLKADGTAILMISEDLEEIIKLADRVGVLYNGQLVGNFPVAEADIETIGLLMAGSNMAEGGAQDAD
ncbi:MAG: ABC transporter ATP-binding protein [Negativicutes bacterium]|nr:ABC transporter ATP-binding protein [Negativicutes bacterium]MDR3592826.1 ABC transporter ATP-binding protein [Negativicutes bacterium]